MFKLLTSKKGTNKEILLALLDFNSKLHRHFGVTLHARAIKRGK